MQLGQYEFVLGAQALTGDPGRPRIQITGRLFICLLYQTQILLNQRVRAGLRL